MAQEAQLISIDDLLGKHTQIAALERAWRVAKALECRDLVDELQWVEPVRDPRGRLRRAIDFGDFPADVHALPPLRYSLNVDVPPRRVMDGLEPGWYQHWTMPLLARVTDPPEITGPVKPVLEFRNEPGNLFSPGELPKVRPMVDTLAFLPFPKAGAGPDEQFDPQFYLSINIDEEIADGDLYAAVVVYNGKVVRQLVNSRYPGSLLCFADPMNQTTFSGDMLVNLSADELAATPADAGEMMVYIYRVTQRPQFSYAAFKHIYTIGDTSTSGDKPAIPIFTFGADEPALAPELPAAGRSDTSLEDTLEWLRSESGTSSSVPTRDLDLGASKSGGGYGGGGYVHPPAREYKSDGHRPPVTPPAEPARPKLELRQGSRPTPERAPREVGRVRVREGKAGERIETETMTGYRVDLQFAIQPIRVTFLGVREGTSEAAAYEALQRKSAQYRR